MEGTVNKIMINKISKISMLMAMLLMLPTACTDMQTAKIAEDEELSTTGTIKDNDSIYDALLDKPKHEDKQNTYDTLNVATYITKVDDMYFIADCYHDQIIYHDNITDPLNEWSVLTDEVHYAHTIATDGMLLLVDDTENNRLLAFQRTDEGYAHTQTLENIGMKPHFVQYDKRRERFMAWSSITGEMYLIKRYDIPNEQGIYPLYIEKTLKIDELYGVYVRSFTLMDDGIYFVSGHNNQKIIKARIVENEEAAGFEITARYEVPAGLAGMVQLYKIQDYYYITVSTDNTENQDCAIIIRTKSLDSLMTGDYEDIYADLGLSGGTPYYINEIEGRYYMTHHRTGENIIAFDVKDNIIENIETIY